MTRDQKSAFLSGEGDSWFERNRSHLAGDRVDVVVEALDRLPVKPRRILEIGASNGHRLSVLKARYGAAVAGVEPSAKGVADGCARFPGVDLRVGTADHLPFEDSSFDMVIFGFCLYLVDPALHFRAIAEADRVLSSPGTLVVFDFIESIPFHNNYAHLAGLRSHKTEWSKFFLASPAYRLVQRLPDLKGADPLGRNELSGVDILRKSLEDAFPANPFT